MNDPLAMRRRECLRDLAGDRNRLVDRNRPTRQAVRERRTFDQLQHEGMYASTVLETVDGGDAGMIERGEHVRFARETCQSLGVVCEDFRQCLQRHVSMQLRVARAIHLPHAARAQNAFDPVRTDMRSGRQARVGIEQIVGQVPHVAIRSTPAPPRGPAATRLRAATPDRRHRSF